MRILTQKTILTRFKRTRKLEGLFLTISPHFLLPLPHPHSRRTPLNSLRGRNIPCSGEFGVVTNTFLSFITHVARPDPDCSVTAVLRDSRRQCKHLYPISNRHL